MQRMRTYRPIRSDISKYRCVICKDAKAYRSKGTLKRHVSTLHFPDVIYRCPIEGCSEETWRRDNYHAHHNRK
ncbi:hypothetical protein BJY01DRAFT_209577 [Aspergillus pseudoustus]|uniref:C2H2-type domain-containing protein n=1 Tax=Aspergillus pseudoustus TaxID=1810923 RepID=A0ABR4KES9_9EURO